MFFSKKILFLKFEFDRQAASRLPGAEKGSNPIKSVALPFKFLRLPNYR
jgi:hypothetical protein